MSQQVFITGAGGFIGSHLTEALVQAGYQVKALVHYRGSGDSGWLKQLPADCLSAIEIVSGDVRDTEHMRQAVQGCELVFHLASLIGIPYSYSAPRSYIETNITGTLNLLQAALAHNARFLHTSTSEVYGSALYVPIDEDHPLQGQSPYSASKIGADMLAQSFQRSFGLEMTVVRPFNTFGPRQSTRAVIPAIISQLLSAKPTLDLGALSPTRDLNYVANTVSAYLSVARSDQVSGEVIHFGSGREISIGDLAQLIMKLSGIEKEIICEEARKRPEQSEVNRLWAKPDKAKKLLGWEPQFSLEEGLQKTIDWVKANPYQSSDYAC